MSFSKRIIYVLRARDFASLALKHWNAADGLRIDQSRRLLEQAASELRLAMATSELPGQSPNEEIVAGIRALRSCVSRMALLVDTCAAFNRELLLRFGETSQVYCASGKAVVEYPRARAVVG